MPQSRPNEVVAPRPEEGALSPINRVRRIENNHVQTDETEEEEEAEDTTPFGSEPDYAPVIHEHERPSLGELLSFFYTHRDNVGNPPPCLYGSNYSYHYRNGTAYFSQPMCQAPPLPYGVVQYVPFDVFVAVESPQGPPVVHNYQGAPMQQYHSPNTRYVPQTEHQTPYKNQNEHQVHGTPYPPPHQNIHQANYNHNTYY